MDDTKKNLSQIEKLVTVAAVACEFNHATQRMPDRGWRVIANDMNVSEKYLPDHENHPNGNTQTTQIAHPSINGYSSNLGAI